MLRANKEIFQPGRLLQTVVNVINSVMKINSLVLDRDTKRKIRETYLHTFFRGRYDLAGQIARIAGFNVKFCTFHSLAFQFNEIFVYQCYWFSADRSSPLIIDCGSNIGMSILYFKVLYPECEIIGFEPDPVAFGCLKENARLNNLSNVMINQNAVSDRDGTIDFFYDQDDPGCLWMSAIRERMPKHSQRVEAVRLARYLDREVDFLKMDVEGAEQDIIIDLSNEGRLGLIKQMVIEYHHHIDRDRDGFSRILKVLEDGGFGYQIEGGMGRPLVSRQCQDLSIYAYRKGKPR
jgi:FkbM family methyltransferase